MRFLQGAPIDHEWIGIRPCRHGGIRLEVEHRQCSGRNLTVSQFMCKCVIILTQAM